ncbi:MAG: ABC transporter permease subunit [Clostridiales bacterium]|nr:ABC transporter permease subunit [Clostridiales bacterium]
MTSTSAHKRRTVLIIKKVAVAAVWLTIWQAAYLLVRQEILLPSPWQTLARLWELAQTAEFWTASLLSLLRIVEGFVLGVVAGTLLGVLTAASSVLYEFFHPAITVIKSTPVASFIILALVWIKKPGVPVFIAFLMVLPIIWANVSEGIRQTDKYLLEMAKVFRFSRKALFAKVYIPAVLPYFFAGCTTSLGLAWKAGIAAEVLSLPAGSIGSKLYYSKIYIETIDLFAWTVAVILLSILLEKLLISLLNKFKNR